MDIAALKDKSVELAQIPSADEEGRDVCRPRLRAFIGSAAIAASVNDFLLPGFHSLLVQTSGWILGGFLLLWDLLRFPNDAKLGVFGVSQNASTGWKRLHMLFCVTALSAFVYAAADAVNFQLARKERLQIIANSDSRLVIVKDLKAVDGRYFVFVQDARSAIPARVSITAADYHGKLKIGQTLRVLAPRENSGQILLADFYPPSVLPPEWSHLLGVTAVIVFFWYGGAKRALGRFLLGRMKEW